MDLLDDWKIRAQVSQVEYYLNSPVKIKGKLFLAGRNILNCHKEYNIDHLITMFSFDHKLSGIKHDIYPIIDLPNDEWVSQLEYLLSKISCDINESLEKGLNVCVHCFAGVSRSPTVVLDFLLTYCEEAKKCESVEEAIEYLGKWRKIVKPNEGFKKLLQKRHFKEIKIEN